MKKEFEEELEDSLYIHRPLPLHRERSLEAGFVRKEILRKQVLFNAQKQAVQPCISGMGELTVCGGQITLRAPLRAASWPEGSPVDGDYCNFGTAGFCLDFSVAHQDWRAYNRLSFWVCPHILGARVLHLMVSVQNSGEIQVPDPYFREGTTVFDLKNEEWNQCVWEFAAMPREAVARLTFYVLCSGHDIGAGPDLIYEFRDICLEQAAYPEHEHGWQNPNPGIFLSTAGYWTDGQKTAVAACAADEFRLMDAKTGRAVFGGSVRRVKNERGNFDVLDFSDFTGEGQYCLVSGDIQSPIFEISHDMGVESLWKVLNFFFCQRCGTPVPGRHSTCHQDILASHNGVSLTFSGGWHDAGDTSQQTVQTGEAVQALFENARRCTKRGQLYLRLMEEAQWGLDFILRTRFGDGYRATSAGATRITDNFMGNFDDVAARVHDHSFENFLLSGIEAYSARTLAGYDDGLAACALRAAEEDYAFAVRKFARTGVEPAHIYEHTHNSGMSQYYATIIWAASCLYEAVGKEAYAADAREYAGRLLACQEQGQAQIGLTGFFYRDESHRAIVHFNHQAREHQFMQALTALCDTQPDAAEYPLWEDAMRRYGDYLKTIAANTSPYGMLPAGVHMLNEWEDSETFRRLHINCDYEREQENYREQLAQGKHLGKGYVLKNFPVWFSFRGNNAVMLSMGKAASLLGRWFGDRKLLELGREQLYWIWGKNPFGQSLIYGAGSNYCRQYAVLSGEAVGEIPVGIETFGNEDIPYWPQNNNATYREVWVGAACRWLQLCADCLEDPKPAQERPKGHLL